MYLYFEPLGKLRCLKAVYRSASVRFGAKFLGPLCL